MVGRFIIIQYIVNACIDFCIPLLAQVELVACVQAPEVIAFAVTVILIIAFALETAIQTYAESIIAVFPIIIPDALTVPRW